MFNTKSTTVAGSINVWVRVLALLAGGFTIAETAGFAVGDEVPAGTLLGYDETARTAKITKVGIAQAIASDSATAYRILKKHNLKVGMAITVSGAGGSQTITAIDTANAAYDEVTVGTTIGTAVAVGDEIYVNDAGYTAATKGLTYRPMLFNAAVKADNSVVTHGTVLSRRIQPLSDDLKAACKGIVFSESK